MERIKESVLPSDGEERIEGVYTLRNESEEELFREMLTLHNQSRDPAKKEREEIESSEKDKPCLTKTMTPPLARMASRKRMPDREWVRSERRAENPGIWKEEDELRLDSWIQMRSTGWDERK